MFSQRVLRVELVKYDNPFNLEIRPDNANSPFCCCNMATPCYPSVQNFSLGICTTTCQLRFTICARMDSPGQETCTISEVEPSGFPTILFYNPSSLFPEASSQLLLDLELDVLLTSVSMCTCNKSYKKVLLMVDHTCTLMWTTKIIYVI